MSISFFIADNLMCIFCNGNLFNCRRCTCKVIEIVISYVCKIACCNLKLLIFMKGYCPAEFLSPIPCERKIKNIIVIKNRVLLRSIAYSLAHNSNGCAYNCCNCICREGFDIRVYKVTIIARGLCFCDYVSCLLRPVVFKTEVGAILIGHREISDAIIENKGIFSVIVFDNSSVYYNGEACL